MSAAEDTAPRAAPLAFLVEASWEQPADEQQAAHVRSLQQEVLAASALSALVAVLSRLPEADPRSLLVRVRRLP